MIGEITVVAPGTGPSAITQVLAGGASIDVVPAGQGPSNGATTDTLVVNQ